MITLEQALTSDHFHLNGCTRKVGPRGGIKEWVVVWYRNGKTKTWKTRPDDWEIPVRHGFWDYGYIHSLNAVHYHTPEDCGILQHER